MNKFKMTGTILAMTAAAAFALAPVVATAGSSAKVNCMGVNSCKGKGACKTASNACKGKNSCKGKGMMQMHEKKCTKKGGTVMPAEPKAANDAGKAAAATDAAKKDDKKGE